MSSSTTSASSPDHTAGPPLGFALNVVQGKRYELADQPVAAYFTGLVSKLPGASVDLDLSQPWHRPGPVFGDRGSPPQHLGQRSFQVVILAAYHRRCAITGTKIAPVPQAAHIRPVTKGGEHRFDNGLLLRSGVHTMFDKGYLAVDTRYRLQVSPGLRSDFGNGEQYYAKAGQPIDLPQRRADRTDHDFLEWHLEEVFMVS